MLQQARALKELTRKAENTNISIAMRAYADLRGADKASIQRAGEAMWLAEYGPRHSCLILRSLQEDHSMVVVVSQSN